MVAVGVKGTVVVEVVATAVVVDVGGTVVVVVVDSVTVEVDAGIVVGTVVSGRLVSGAVVSTDVCVSGGGAVGMVAATVEEVVAVDDEVVTAIVEEVVVVDVELVCSTDVSVRVVSVDVDVETGDDSPHQDNESKSHKSESAPNENFSMALPSFATKETVVSQQVPSMGTSVDVPSV